MRRILGALAIVVVVLSPLSAASVDGLKLHSSSAGKGSAALIFVHGWTCDDTSWSAQVPEFARKYRVLTLDLPGLVKSVGSRPPRLYGRRAADRRAVGAEMF